MPEKIEDYIKQSYGKLEGFFKIYENGLEKYAGLFDIGQEEKDALIGAMNTTKTDYTVKTTARAAAKAATQKFKKSKENTVKSIRKSVRKIKAHNNYSVTIGKEMGIVGEEAHYDQSKMQPKLRLLLNAGVVEIRFKKSFSEGINIYSKRGDETEFTFLARDTRSPYTDKRSNPAPGEAETRQYYAFYVFNDEEQGLRSEVYEIAVKG